MDIQEFVRRYTAGERDFAGIDLIGIDFDALYGSFEGIPDEVIAYLNEIDFTSFDLGRELREQYAAGRKDFSGLNLSGVDITGVDLDSIAFDDFDLLPDELITDLREINLSGANLTKTIFGGADLSRVRLFMCNLTETNLSGANLTQAAIGGVRLINTILRGADLFHADISGSVFKIDPKGVKNIETIHFEGTSVRNLVLDSGAVIDFDYH